MLISALLFTALAVVAPRGEAGEPAYRWLTSSELEALIRGTRMVENNNKPSYMKTPEEFRRDGSHVRYADNYEAHGKYRIKDDEVCVEADGASESCRRLLLDKDGQYWIVGREKSRLLIKVSVQRTPPDTDPWPSGEAEAFSDLSNGRPIRLYTHVWAGERAGFRSPGLLYCDPDQNIGNKAAEEMFAFIPEANQSEGVIYTAAEQAMQRSAFAFALAYNLTIYRQKRDHIVRLCPKVELERQRP